MPREDRRRREREARRRQIIAAARAIAEAEGWDAVTTRRLADTIGYSQPVLYSHFPHREAIVAAVALEGFAALAEAARTARTEAATPLGALEACATAYLDFADRHPALYDAMFTRPSHLPFASPRTPTELTAAYDALRAVFAPLASGRDVDTLTEVGWSALHGLATLTRAERLRPGAAEQRTALLVRLLAAVPDSPR